MVFPIKESRVREIFDDFVQQFSPETEVPVQRKIDHSLRVADEARTLGEQVLGQGDFTWFLGMCHDLGRFLQWREFKSFNDKNSDHAQLSIAALYGIGVGGKDALINQMAPGIVFDPLAMQIVTTAIVQHSRVAFSGIESESVLMEYAQILRDADIMDNFMFNFNLSDPARLESLLHVNGFNIADLPESKVSPEVYSEFMQGRAIDRSKIAINTPADQIVVWAGYFFNLSLAESKKKALPRIMEMLLDPTRFTNLATQMQFATLRKSPGLS